MASLGGAVLPSHLSPQNALTSPPPTHTHTHTHAGGRSCGVGLAVLHEAVASFYDPKAGCRKAVTHFPLPGGVRFSYEYSYSTNRLLSI
jgi:hypothetical protein